jgi:endonuclease YncB( thermonuclease family)
LVLLGLAAGAFIALGAPFDIRHFYAWDGFDPVDAIRLLARTDDVPSNDRQTVKGQASVIDGDTIEIHGQRIRFHGIDAPESRQFCDDAHGKPYRCGQKTALALSEKIGRRTVTCEPHDRDRYGRIVAVCWIGLTDLNGWLVLEGLAIAYRRYSHDYVAEEDAARQARRGIWAGSFVAPAEWRKSERQH